MRISTSKSEAMVLDRQKVACSLVKLSIYRSIYVPTLTYGHELWVMTERIRSQIQAAEMSFLCRVAGCSLRDEGGARSRAAAPPHREEPAEVARASVSDAPRTPPSGGVLGMSRREETPRKAQDTLE